MAALAGDLSRQILSHSDAARAFRPWWDNLEDSLMYSLVIMGLITLPMTFLTGTPIECTIHPALWEANSSVVIDGALMHPDVVHHYKYLRLYPKKYCTEIKVSPFLLYFPFCLFIVPLILVSVEKLFIGLYDAQTRLETLYSSLVKSSLEREDVANMEKENEKNSYEIRQELRNSSGCYYSYLYRTMVELVASICLAIFFCGFSQIDGIATNSFDCNTHGVGFICVIPNSKFFSVVYYMSLCSILGYMCLTMYNLFWLVHPNVGRLESVLSGCERRSSSSVEIFDPVVSRGIKYGPEIRLDMYYDRKARDFKLLMDLLAEQSGLAQSFRILAVFDKHFQRLWRARDIKIIIQRNISNGVTPPPSITKAGDNADETPEVLCQNPASLWVLWNDAEIANYMNRRVKRSFFEYTVEISPPTEASIKSFLYHKVPNFNKYSQINNSSASRKTSEAKLLIPGDPNDNFSVTTGRRHSDDEDLGARFSTMYKYSTRFDGLSLDNDTVYTVTISTELDGKTITQICQQTDNKDNLPASPPKDSKPSGDSGGGKKDKKK